MQIRTTAWTLAQLPSLAVRDAFPIEAVAPSRTQWLCMEFADVPSRRLRPQVPEIRLPGTAQRPPLEALALQLSGALYDSSRFVVGFARSLPRTGAGEGAMPMSNVEKKLTVLSQLFGRYPTLAAWLLLRVKQRRVLLQQINSDGRSRHVCDACSCGTMNSCDGEGWAG